MRVKILQSDSGTTWQEVSVSFAPSTCSPESVRLDGPEFVRHNYHSPYTSMMNFPPHWYVNCVSVGQSTDFFGLKCREYHPLAYSNYKPELIWTPHALQSQLWHHVSYVKCKKCFFRKNGREVWHSMSIFLFHLSMHSTVAIIS